MHHLGAFLEVLGQAGVNVACGRDTIEVEREDVGPGDFKPVDGEDRAVAGSRDGLQPPTCVLLTRRGPLEPSTRRLRGTASSGWASCSGWAPTSISSTSTCRDHRPAKLHGEEVEIGDLRAGASLILAALAATGTTTIHVRITCTWYENIERKFLDLGPGSSARGRGTGTQLMKIGIDLGKRPTSSSNVKGKGIVLQEPSVWR